MLCKRWILFFCGVVSSFLLEYMYINSNTFAKQIQNFYHHHHHYYVVLCNGKRNVLLQRNAQLHTHYYITRTAKTLKYSPSGNMGSIG